MVSCDKTPEINSPQKSTSKIGTLILSVRSLILPTLIFQEDIESSDIERKTQILKDILYKVFEEIYEYTGVSLEESLSEESINKIIESFCLDISDHIFTLSSKPLEEYCEYLCSKELYWWEFDKNEEFFISAFDLKLSNSSFITPQKQWDFFKHVEKKDKKLTKRIRTEIKTLLRNTIKNIDYLLIDEKYWYMKDYLEEALDDLSSEWRMFSILLFLKDRNVLDEQSFSAIITLFFSRRFLKLIEPKDQEDRRLCFVFAFLHKKYWNFSIEIDNINQKIVKNFFDLDLNEKMARILLNIKVIKDIENIEKRKQIWTFVMNNHKTFFLKKKFAFSKVIYYMSWDIPSEKYSSVENFIIRNKEKLPKNNDLLFLFENDLENHNFSNNSRLVSKVKKLFEEWYLDKTKLDNLSLENLMYILNFGKKWAQLSILIQDILLAPEKYVLEKSPKPNIPINSAIIVNETKKAQDEIISSSLKQLSKKEKLLI